MLRTWLRVLRYSPKAFGVLCVALALTFGAWTYTRSLVERIAQAHFQDNVREVETWVHNRLDLYINALYSARAFFAGSQNVERHEWAAYVRRENLGSRYPGLLATGFVKRVGPGESETFVSENFPLHPAGNRPEYYAVTYIEPQEGNAEKLGLDVAFEPRRWSALTQARDGGEAAATHRVDLMQETDRGAVFEVYVPIYHQDAPTSTVEQRRAGLAGFVFSTFNIDDLLSGVFSDKRRRPAIDFQIYDGEVLSEESLIYAGSGFIGAMDFRAHSRFTAHSILQFGGRTWSLRFAPLPTFGLEFPQEYLPHIVLFGGLAGSFLLFAILYSLAVARHRGLKLAEFGAIVQSLDDAVIGMDLEGRVASWNPAAERIYGYSAPEMIGKTLSILAAPERRQEMQEILARIRRGERIDYLETARLRKDGRHIHVSITVSPILDYSGALKGVSSIEKDITQIKQAGELLQRSRDFYLTLFEEFPNLIWRSSPDGSRNYFNRTWLAFTGRGFDQERADGWRGRLHPDDRERYLEAYRKALAEQGPYEIEYRLRRNDDQYRWLVEHGQPFLGMDGRFSGFIGSCTDISDRKKADQDLRHSLDLLFAVIENIPNMIFLKEAGELRFELFNRAGEELLGITRQEMIGKNDYDFFPREQADFFTRHDYEVLRDRKMKDIPEETIQTRDKGERILHTKKVPIVLDARGNPMYLLGISEDITERAANEKQLREAFENLEKAHAELKETQAQLIRAEKFAAMGKLSGMISHEFRNQLGVIRNSAYFIKMRFKGDDEKVKNHLDILEKEIDETNRIIDNILSFAKKNQPELTTVRLESIVEACLAKTRVPPGIKVTVKFEKSLPEIRADEILLGRVFLNLILNAVQAMKVAGKLMVKAAVSGRFVALSFEDTGAGIREEDKKHIFDPLFSTKERGTGLGLATARVIVEAHGGTIDIESHFGRGTTVMVRLPAFGPK